MNKDITMTINERDTSLKECPFCGEVPMSVTAPEGHTAIGCDNCNPLSGWMVYGETREEAARIWNKAYRAPFKDRVHDKFLNVCLRMAATDLEHMAGQRGEHGLLTPDDIKKLHQVAVLLRETAEEVE